MPDHLISQLWDQLDLSISKDLGINLQDLSRGWVRISQCPIVFTLHKKYNALE